MGTIYRIDEYQGHYYILLIFEFLKNWTNCYQLYHDSFTYSLKVLILVLLGSGMMKLRWTQLSFFNNDYATYTQMC